MAQVLFLNYHSLDIGRKSDIYHVDAVYSVRQADFKAQMQLIRDLKIPVISLDQYVAQVRLQQPFRENTLVITFDDGFLTDYEVAYPLLKQHGFPATFFVCLLNLKSEDRWSQFREMIADGFTIGSHTVSHPYLSDLEPAELERELAVSKEILARNTGREVRFLAPPGGRYNAAVIREAKKLGYEALVTTRIGLNDHTSDLMQLKRWTVRYQTTLPEFKKMIRQDARTIRVKQIKSRTLNLGKKLLGNRTFDRVRNLLLPHQS